MQIKVELTDEAKAVIRDVQRLPDSMLAGIVAAMDKQNPITVSHIQQSYLSFPSDGPATPIGCRHITGQLKRTLRPGPATISGQTVTSSIGSNLEYAAFQEFGGDIPAHKITAKNAKALRFQIGQRVVFSKSVNIPARHQEGRGFVQRGINDRANDYARAIGDAIIKAWKP